MKIVLNVDETGMWVTGVRKLLHIANIEFLNWYGYHRKRGTQAIDDLQILPGLRGTLVSDFWVPYFLNPSHLALYNAHLLYELKEISENYHQTWNARIPGIKNEVDGLHEHSDFFFSNQKVEQFEERYSFIIEDRLWENTVPDSTNRVVRRGRKTQSMQKIFLTVARSSRAGTFLSCTICLFHSRITWMNGISG